MFVTVVGGGVCGCSWLAVFVEDFEFPFLFLFSFVEVFGFGIVGDPVIVIVVCGGRFSIGGDLPLPLVVCGG